MIYNCKRKDILKKTLQNKSNKKKVNQNKEENTKKTRG